MADGVIITGRLTGKPVNIEDLKRAKEYVNIPVIAGSGVNPENVKEILKYADGVVVGTYFKKEGRIDVEKVKELANLIKIF
jgi:hypothetical protein